MAVADEPMDASSPVSPIAKRKHNPQPARLIVERLLTEGDDLALFSWQPATRQPAELSPSERDVLALLVTGASNAEIARERATSPRTVANQVAAILQKTGCPSRFDLIRLFAGGTLS